jgi:hypothetical protein
MERSFLKILHEAFRDLPEATSGGNMDIFQWGYYKENKKEMFFPHYRHIS